MSTSAEAAKGGTAVSPVKQAVAPAITVDLAEQHVPLRRRLNAMLLGGLVAGGAYYNLHTELHRNHATVAAELHRTGGWPLPMPLLPAPEPTEFNEQLRSNFEAG